MAGLSETDEALIKLKHMDGLSHKEIASIVGKSEDAVRQALSRAMRELRTLLESTDHEVPN
jgi:RNA polymerase sigma factor (sigma-70 family)